MSEFIDRVLKRNKHEEQSYNACMGILQMAKDLPHGMVEETAQECIKLNSCSYKTFQKMLGTLRTSNVPDRNTLPEHKNIRGKDFYR